MSREVVKNIELALTLETSNTENLAGYYMRHGRSAADLVTADHLQARAEGLRSALRSVRRLAEPV